MGAKAAVYVNGAGISFSVRPCIRPSAARYDPEPPSLPPSIPLLSNSVTAAAAAMTVNTKMPQLHNHNQSGIAATVKAVAPPMSVAP